MDYIPAILAALLGNYVFTKIMKSPASFPVKFIAFVLACLIFIPAIISLSPES